MRKFAAVVMTGAALVWAVAGARHHAGVDTAIAVGFGIAALCMWVSVAIGRKG